MRKTLLIGGDSWCDVNQYWEQKKKFPLWYDYIAEKLDMNVVSLGLGGAGNEYICSTLIDYMNTHGTDHIGMVMASWSECNRGDWETQIPEPCRAYPYEWQSRKEMVDGQIYGFIKKSLRWFYIFQSICENKKIPYKQFQMIPLYYSHIYEKFYNLKSHSSAIGEPEKSILKAASFLFEQPEYELIDKDHFIGWPVANELPGGFHIAKKTVHPYSPDGYKKCDPKYVIDVKKDQHPNELGHKLIAEFIYENL